MKRFHDWYQIQKDFQGWGHIDPDTMLVEMLSDKGWCLDLTRCHASLRERLEPLNVVKPAVDFFVTTDIELSKLPLEVFFKLIRAQYNNTQHGGYIAVLSYFLNSIRKYKELTGNYSENIDSVFRANFDYVNKIENKSCVTDYPSLSLKKGIMVEGSNFIFVHPNIRYFLWKQ